MVSGPLTPSDVATLIAAGEDSYTEFKASASANADIAKELVAFLNGDGGRVLIGVEDDGSITGLRGWDEEKLMNIARTLINPPIIPIWQRLVVGTTPDIAVVSVGRGSEKPYSVGGGEGKRYYVRVGSTSREASREELIRLLQASGAVQGDLRPALGATLDDLSREALAERFRGRRSVVWDELSDSERRRILIEAEILHRSTGGPTIAGMLCYGVEPQRQLPGTHVQCVAYPGSSVTRELIDQEQVGGRIDEQVRTAAQFIDRNLARASIVRGLDRVDAPRPTIETLREIVANAVAHRQYGIEAPVHVRVFTDRVVVVSPGGLPNGVTPHAMRVGVSVPRNPFLVQFLVERRLVDALGRGIVLAFEEAIALGLQEPQIETPDGFVEVRLAVT
jgi:ATP-dependent DNA helicase RecG